MKDSGCKSPAWDVAANQRFKSDDVPRTEVDYRLIMHAQFFRENRLVEGRFEFESCGRLRRASVLELLDAVLALHLARFIREGRRA